MDIKEIENKIELIRKDYRDNSYNKYNRNDKLSKTESTYLFMNLIPYFKMLTPMIFNFQETNKGFLNHMGLFQAIYIQQDLINELLTFFKLNGFTSEDVNPNRMIRNKVLGHPISRDENNNFTSSVWINKDIIWIYEKEVNEFKEKKDLNFNHRKITYDIKTVLIDHYKFLNKYLDKVISKLEQNMIKFKKSLLELQSIIKHNKFEGIIKSVEYKYELFFEDRYVFKKEIIKKIYTKRSIHPRYQFCIDLFCNELSDYILDSLNSLNRRLEPLKYKLEFPENFDKVITVSSNSFPIFFEKRKMIFSKLNPKEEVLGIDYHLKLFYDNYDITLELLNMKNNEDHSEYYSSKMYLEHLHTIDNKYFTSDFTK